MESHKQMTPVQLKRKCLSVTSKRLGFASYDGRSTYARCICVVEQRAPWARDGSAQVAESNVPEHLDFAVCGWCPETRKPYLRTCRLVLQLGTRTCRDATGFVTSARKRRLTSPQKVQCKRSPITARMCRYSRLEKRTFISSGLELNLAFLGLFSSRFFAHPNQGNLLRGCSGAPHGIRSGSM